MNPIIGVVNIGAAAKQKCKSHGGDQPKDLCDVPIVFPFSCHAFGRPFDGTPFANAS